MEKEIEDMTIRGQEYAIVVQLEEDKMGRATGESMMSLLYHPENKWDQQTHNGVVDMLTSLCEIVNIMEKDSEFRKIVSTFIDKHAIKVPDLKIVEKKDNVIKVDWSKKR